MDLELELRLGSEIAVSLSPVHGFGTVYLSIQTWNSENSNDC